eukprot:CAMPEP_0201650072 /NCGR_PEP_ID=MMETSP0493-20130528/40530_1 /ASSEMBLY_ACC=CAM_ASM_000838 /TAXON_ID=420259 /ORGANISM="Thalassiosira gravida, Strain GMp14c1" /LENGTH=63 /DNA_ID=CAMNT_0048126073 /DNA_START=20 /DNA_END=208 /DNA_ORIENTATION=+
MKYCFLDTMEGDDGDKYSNQFIADDTVTSLDAAKDEETAMTFETVNDLKDWNSHADEDTAREA